MTSFKRYASTLTTGPTLPIEIKVIYDNTRYHCELRECGRIVKTLSGDFLKQDLLANFKWKCNSVPRLEKLMEIIQYQADEITRSGSKNIKDYTFNISIQPVKDVNEPATRIHGGIIYNNK